MSEVLPASSHSRRGFLRLAAGGLGAALVACTPARGATLPVPVAPSGERPQQASPQPTPVPKPVSPAGRFERPVMPGTPWETPLTVTHSGRQGPTVLVLGGVHGNEPGGWLAAEQVATCEPMFGSLLVIPRANRIADRMLERTTTELGDLNRLYPGTPDADLPMARMANAIIEIAREFDARYLLDMHESWVFYAERPQNGTAYLGQTIASGEGPEANTLARELADRANESVGVRRDLFWTRDQLQLPGPVQTPAPVPPGRGGGLTTSSLGVGRYVPGLTPILVEMGQQDQPVERRSELHLIVARALMNSRGML